MVGIGREVLAGVAHAHPGAVEGDEPVVMLGCQLGLCRGVRLRQGLAGEARRHRGDEPGPPDRRPADHHRVGARRLEAGPRVVEARHVAVGDERDRHRVADQADRRPVGPAGVELLPGAAVHRDGGIAEPFRPAGEVRGVAGGVVPAQPHLDGDRHRDRATHRGEQALGMVEVAHQGRAGLAAGHGLGRAAHVDVDHVGAVGLGEPRALRHPARVAAGELDDVGQHALALGPQARLLGAAGEILRRHHLGDGRGGTQPTGDAAHVQVGDAGQGRQERPAARRGARSALRACSAAPSAPAGGSAAGDAPEAAPGPSALK